MLLRLLQSPVISVGRPITPSESIRFLRRFNRRFFLTFIPFDLPENVECISVNEGIRSALRRLPYIIEQFAGRCEVVLLSPQLRQRDQRG